jgi:hypothetical protein
MMCGWPFLLVGWASGVEAEPALRGFTVDPPCPDPSTKDLTYGLYLHFCYD